MKLNKREKYNVVFHNRKAVLCGYFDQACLLFDKKDGKPDLGNIKVIDDYPKGNYCVLFSHLPVEERKQIRLENSEPLSRDCVCSLFLDDKPNSSLLKDYIEILGDDPIDYEVLDDYADPSNYATVKCKVCGKMFKVNRNPGYRTSYFKWSLFDCDAALKTQL